MFIDEKKKEKIVFGAFTASMETCWYRAHKTCGQGGGEAVPVKKAASLGMAASNSGDNTQEVPRGENNGSHSSAEGQKYGCD